MRLNLRSIQGSHKSWPKDSNAPYRHQISNIHGQWVVHFLAYKRFWKYGLASMYVNFIRGYDECTIHLSPWGTSEAPCTNHSSNSRCKGLKQIFNKLNMLQFVHIEKMEQMEPDNTYFIGCCRRHWRKEQVNFLKSIFKVLLNHCSHLTHRNWKTRRVSEVNTWKTLDHRKGIHWRANDYPNKQTWPKR